MYNGYKLFFYKIKMSEKFVPNNDQEVYKPLTSQEELDRLQIEAIVTQNPETLPIINERIQELQRIIRNKS